MCVFDCFSTWICILFKFVTDDPELLKILLYGGVSTMNVIHCSTTIEDLECFRIGGGKYQISLAVGLRRKLRKNKTKNK